MSCNVQTKSWAAFGALVRTFAGRLLRHVGRGDTVVLHYYNSLTFVVASHACFLVGVVAIPINPIDLKRLDEDVPVLLGACAKFSAKAILYGDAEEDAIVSPKLKSYLTERALELPNAIQVTINAGATAASEALTQSYPVVRATDAAVVLLNVDRDVNVTYVALTHGELMAQTAVLAKSLECDKSKCLFSCVRTTFGPGYIIGVLLGVYLGAPTLIVSPREFAAAPPKIFSLMGKCGVEVAYTTAPMLSYSVSRHSGASIGQTLTSLARTGTKKVLVAYDGTGRENNKSFLHEIVGSMYMGDCASYPVSCGGSGGAISQCISIDALSHWRVERVPESRSSGNLRGTWRATCVGVPTCGTSLAISHPALGEVRGHERIGLIFTKHELLKHTLAPLTSANHVDFNRDLKLRDSSYGDEEAFKLTGDIGFIANGQLHVVGSIADAVMIENGSDATESSSTLALLPIFESTISNACNVCAGSVIGSVLASVENGKLSVYVELSSDAKVDTKAQQHLESSVLSLIPQICHEMRAEHGVSVHEFVCVKKGEIPRSRLMETQRVKFRLQKQQGKLQEPFLRVTAESSGDEPC